MANKKPLFLYSGLRFDSNEQIYVYCWLQQCMAAGIVTQFNYHPDSYVLFEGARFGKRSLLQPHVYTSDFEINFNTSGINTAIAGVFKYTTNFAQKVVVDVKGGFSIYHDSAKHSVNQKWVYDKYGIYVYKIQPDKLFQATFVPQYCRYTPKKHQLRQKYASLKTIKEFTQDESHI